MKSDVSTDPLVSSLLPTSRRRTPDEPLGPALPPAWRETGGGGRSLTDLSEPLFLLVCRLNRARRVGVSLNGRSAESAARVRAEVLRMLDAASATAGADGLLRSSFARVRRPLELFFDDVMSRRFTELDDTWLPLAEPGSGFFSLLDLALAETDAGATDRLAVFYNCLALGYRGGAAGHGKSVETYLAKLTARLSGRMDADDSAPICPDAYRHTDRRPLSEPVAGKVIAMLLVAAMLVLVAVALSGTLYFLRVSSLQRDLDTFRRAAQTPASAAPAPGRAGGAP